VDEVPYRIAVVEDHLLQRTYTSALLGQQPHLEVVRKAETLPSLMGWLRTAPSDAWPQLVLLDLMAERQPNALPSDVKTLVEAGTRVLIFSALASPPLVRRMLREGAQGVLGKRDGETEILRAVDTVLRGGFWHSTEWAGIVAHDPERPALSDQEERVLVLYATGLSLEAVAAAVGVQRETAKKYLQRVKSKYAAIDRPAGSRIELYRAAHTDGYIF